MSSVLRGGYKTTFDSLDSQFPKTFKSETDEYDYDSDSDIDGDEEGDENLPNSASVPGMPAAEKAGDVSPSLDRDIRDIKNHSCSPQRTRQKWTPMLQSRFLHLAEDKPY